MHADGSQYSVDGLYPDQKVVVAKVMDKLHEWLHCDDLSKFKPLRLTLNGAGGSGKSVIINTIVSTIRRMFNCNDVVRVAAPTGTAAFNVNGETLHHLLHNRVEKFGEFSPGSMDNKKRKKLVKKFKTLLALIIDERSLLSCKELGTAERMMGETIHGGGLLDHLSFGGLPILILVGDDYQLPATGGGAATQALFGGGRESKMQRGGRKVFLDCAKHVFELTSSKRMQDDKIQDKVIIQKLRTRETLTEAEVAKVMSLKLETITQQHGQAVTDDIKAKAIYLFFRNEPRLRKNLECLKDAHSKDRPVGFFRTKCYGGCGGKSIREHFDDPPPETSIFCVGSRVAINGRNLNPTWGLFNGACGSVIEIVMKEGGNPNHGDLPLYTVIDFPHYCGPVWDKNNPTVCRTCVFILGYPESGLTSLILLPARPHSYNELHLQKRKAMLLAVVRPPDSRVCQDHSQIPRPERWACRRRQDKEYVRNHHL